MLNGVSDRLHIIDGNTDDLWAPVQEKKFDYIISNPPFMPTPPDFAHYFHSGGGGILGLDFLEKILKQLDNHLAPGGWGQIVTAAPGNSELPTTLLGMTETYLSGHTEVIIDPLPLPFTVLTHHIPDSSSMAQMKEIDQQLQEQGITHQYLCVIHYTKSNKRITTKFSEPHPGWDMPLADANIM